MKKLVATITFLFSIFFVADVSYAYTVKKGDTMTQIAKAQNLTLQQLSAMNPQIKNLDKIYIGDTIHTEVPIKMASTPQSVSTIDPNIDHLAQYVQASIPIVQAGASNEQILEVALPTENTFTIASSEREETIKMEEKPVLNVPTYTDEEIDLLARLVRAEAQIEPFNGKVAVACVVLNRVESPLFPDTIKDVIYESGQFQPVSNGEIYEPADEESIAAVKAALTDQRNIAPGSLFFYNPTIATSRWLDSRDTTMVIGQHVFKK